MTRMTVRKSELLDLLRKLPEKVDLDDLIYRLYLREKIAAAEADIAAGRVLSAQEVRRQSRTWRR
ncbi:MAG: hypothetical protein L0216_00815 [Planctomycetales bacterium]|nr:hypothetical protein [Planctomycetales bacterium]